MSKIRQTKFSLIKKITILIIAVTIALSLSIFFISGKIIKDIIIDQYSTLSIEITKIVAANLDTKKVENIHDSIKEIFDNTEDKVRNDNWGTPEWEKYVSKYKDIEKTEDFLSLREDLRKMQEASRAECLYLVYLDENEKASVYMVDATDYDNEGYCPPGCFDQIYLNEKETKELFEHLGEEGIKPNITQTDEYGWLIATSMPIYNDNNEIIGFAAVDFLMQDIMSQRNKFWVITGITLLIIAFITAFIAIVIVNRQVVKPIKLLSQTARMKQEKDSTKISYNFQNLNIKTRDEIEELSNSMSSMENEINKHIEELMETKTQLSEMSEIAQKDSLTGVRNKYAYAGEIEILTEEMKEGKDKFGFVMIDLNYLKTINDTYGHDKGDIAIKNICDIICGIFKRSPVFRIGGDEFAVILKNSDYNNVNSLVDSFKKIIDKNMENKDSDIWNHPTAAIGYALYDKTIDKYVEDVFRRADKEMYEAKTAMKCERK